MKFSLDTASVFIPGGQPSDQVLHRTTHLAIGAHQDDLEIMAIDGILQCFQQTDRRFTGVVVTDGSGSPRSGLYQNYTDHDMQAVRAAEQKKAALIGDYAAQILLNHPSAAVKDASNPALIDDLRQIVEAAQPEIIYTHNLADKHPTHVAVALRVITALRRLPAQLHPQKLYGCEVWRDLGWMLDEDKVVFDCSDHENVQLALLGVFDSQISGGKRYDLATMGRRWANATYFESHGVDTMTGLAFGMDLTPLIADPSLDVMAYLRRYITRFSDDVQQLVAQYS